MSRRARLAGFWALLHPGPSLFTVLAFALCALIAGHGRPAIGRLVLASSALICQQFAISALNDYCDRKSDALLAHKRKPIVLGLVSPNVALATAVLLTVAMFGLILPLGFLATLLASWFLALGFAYDLGVKSTPFSGVMHGLAFPTIPLLAWSLFATLHPALLWAFPLGMAVGVGIHLADALPDAEADAAAGVRGLVQALGPRALVACWGMIGVALLVITGLALGQFGSGAAEVLLATVLVGGGVLGGAIVLYQQEQLPVGLRLKRNLRLMVGTALIVVVGWFTSIIV